MVGGGTGCLDTVLEE